MDWPNQDAQLTEREGDRMKRDLLKLGTRLALTVATVVGTLVATATPAQADSFDLTSCHATTGCVDGAIYGTVTLTQTDADSVRIDVVLTGGSYFVETGAGAMSLFLFNATAGMTVDTSTATATFNGTDVTSTLGGLSYVFTPPPGVQADGTGKFTGQIVCAVADNCNGSSIVTTVNDLHFTVDNATLAQLETTNSGGNLFVADIAIFGNGANTGDVDVTPPGDHVPDGGATVTLLGSALLGLGMLRRRFRRS
jgi:hypothetical protein